jgi:arginyl-tRNA synthetase
VGESFYQSRMGLVFALLQERNLLQEDNGRYILWTQNASIPLIIKKSDGGFTYDTSDLATIRYRIDEAKCDWLIYVIDQGQSDHMSMVFQAARELGWLTKKTRVDHVGFGLVLGSDKKKFKTRSGETVRLRDLLDEGVERALQRLKESEADKIAKGGNAAELTRTEEQLKATAEALAYSCVKYADLSHNRNSDYEFSFDKMLSDKGNTACYLLYAFARIRSIFRQPEIAQLDMAAARKSVISLEHPKERRLALHISKFGDVVERLLRDLLPHFFCDYLYELSGIFTDFYDNCYVISKPRDSDERIVNVSRVLLCEATVAVMGKCFDILGFRAQERI